VSHSANVRAFAGDPDLPLLLSLENYDDDTNTATKTAIFRERTIQRRQPVACRGRAKEALVITLSEKGRVDLAHIGRLLGQAGGRVPAGVGRGVLPQPVENQRGRRTTNTCPAMSGGNSPWRSTRPKPIRSIVKTSRRLRAVQPADLKATEIDARLGSAWIPARTMLRRLPVELLRAIGREDVRVNHAAQVGLWTVEVSSAIKTGVADRSEWGTARVPATS
jgi:N12 class adenine-specific DNA methylase